MREYAHRMRIQERIADGYLMDTDGNGGDLA
jgi:hypothetical protein